MCTVQVLLFADVMGRTNSVQGVRSGTGVCRRLFANDRQERADPSVLLKRVEEQLLQQSKERWNFDFQTGTPLRGRYEWMPVCAPAAPKKDETTVIVEASPSPAQSTSSSMQASKRKRSNTSTQPKITEFMTKRKRASHVVPEEGMAHKLKVRRLNSSRSSSDHLTANMRPR